MSCKKQQKNRRLLFGYCIVDGKRTINRSEAEIVVWLYEKYLLGYSYKTLTESLQSCPIKYRSDETAWNKNMVQRILNREEYCGAKGYPQIIERQLYEAVQNKREQKAQQVAVREEWPKEIREKLYCYHCGGRIIRMHPGSTINWQCQEEGRTTNGFITDDVLVNEIIERTNQIIQKPELLQIEKENPFELSLAIMQANNEIIQEIQKKEKSDSEIEQLIFAAATMRYQHCSAMDDTYYTDMLIKLYGECDVIQEIDFELINKSVKKILLASSGQVHFEMLNGKII